MKIPFLILAIAGLFASVSAQSVDIYKQTDDRPATLIKRNTGKEIRIAKDSLILQGDVEIGKISEWPTGDPNQRKFVLYLMNGKAIGDVFIKDVTKHRAIIYSNEDGVETKVEFNPSLKNNELKIYFIQYFIKNKFL